MTNVEKLKVEKQRLVVTQLFKADWFDRDWRGDENIGSLHLTERGGKTTLGNTTLYKSRAARDGALESGMSDGMEAGYARIDELLATLHG